MGKRSISTCADFDKFLSQMRRLTSLENAAESIRQMWMREERFRSVFRWYPRLLLKQGEINYTGWCNLRQNSIVRVSIIYNAAATMNKLLKKFLDVTVQQKTNSVAWELSTAVCIAYLHCGNFIQINDMFWSSVSLLFLVSLTCFKRWWEWKGRLRVLGAFILYWVITLKTIFKFWA